MAIVTLDEMKSELGITDDTDDALITAKIAEAQSWIELFLGYSIETKFTTIPDDLKTAVKLQTAHLFENREATAAGVTIMLAPSGLDDILRERRSYAYE